MYSREWIAEGAFAHLEWTWGVMSAAGRESEAQEWMIRDYARDHTCADPGSGCLRALCRRGEIL